ncbi:MAG TPA: LDCC motif putative metal-binding protein [Bacillota bacterium]|nr:LDCC motif putative metal-binding protein [Bacillota bacterium]
MFQWWKSFLKRLEEANKREFGNQRLECCELNRKTKR